MNGLTSLFKPLYDIRQDFTRGIQKVESIKMPSLVDVKGYVSRNRYFLAAYASPFVGFGLSCITRDNTYALGSLGVGTFFFAAGVADNLRKKNRMLWGLLKRSNAALGKSMEYSERLLDYADLLEREIAKPKGKSVA